MRISSIGRHESPGSAEALRWYELRLLNLYRMLVAVVFGLLLLSNLGMRYFDLRGSLLVAGQVCVLIYALAAAAIFAISEARLKELGAAGFMQPLKVSCLDHEGGGAVKFQQWDGTKWKVSPCDTTLTSARSPTACLISKAAIAPPSPAPRTTICGLAMVDSLPKAPVSGGASAISARPALIRITSVRRFPA